MPLVECVLFLALWMVLLIPLSILTTDKKTIENVQASSASDQVLSCWLEVRFSESPEHFTIRQGSVILADVYGHNENIWSEMVPMISYNEQIELAVEMDWHTDGNRAVEITLAPEGLSERQKTHWTEDRSLQKIWRFSW